MTNLVENLLNNVEVRSSISELRSMIKEEEPLNKLKALLEDHKDVINGFLKSQDAKTRKNTALLIGDLGWDDSVDYLYQALMKETMLFVRSSYLIALGKIDSQKLIPNLKDRMNELLKEDAPIETKKHVEDELREIRKILIKYEGITRHTFIGQEAEPEVLLICNKNHRQTVKEAFPDNKASVHPLGVVVKNTKLDDLYKVRSFRDIAFPIHTKGLVASDPAEAAKQLWQSDLYDLLTELHKEGGPFYYRIELKTTLELDEKTRFAKKLGTALEQESGGRLINSTGDYEIELRLIANKEGKYFPCIRLMTMKDKRFAYRKNAISASIHPSTAALIMELSKEYLLDNAQVLDPFCGVGTMLIERNYAVHAKDMYGIDIFGDAIEMARENTEITGMKINYIHRDFMDFKHEYKFDEIMTNMPIKGKKTKEELDSLYGGFFDKAATILNSKGLIVMYTNEMGLVKKQLRLHGEYKLIKEICMQSKNNFYLMIIGYVG